MGTDIHPEIKALKKYFDPFEIKILKSNELIRDDLFFVALTIDQESWKILIDDEYSDFDLNKPLVNWFLILSALEIYAQTDDFLSWAKQKNIDASSIKWLTYYKSLTTIYQEIEKKLGKIDSCISHYDYNLRTGAIVTLLK